MSKLDRIMYVCSECADNNPEGCGTYDNQTLVVMPDDRWLCEACFDDEPGDLPPFRSLPNPPEYAPSHQANAEASDG